MPRMKSRWGSVLLGALLSVLLGSGAAQSHPRNARQPLARTMLDSGAYDSVLLREDGTVWVWGNPYIYYQEPAPAPMAGLTDVVAVSSGAHVLALRADGTVWAWGSNMYGELGDDTYHQASRSTAAPVLGLTDVVAVSAGYAFSMALRADGTVWAWGLNGYEGRLGLGEPSDWANDWEKRRPVQVPGLVDVVAISAGGSHTLALRADGTVWAWGDNWSGQIGGATTQETSFVPVQVPGLSHVKHIDAGTEFNLVLRMDGTVWAWGDNWGGQLGDGTTTNRSTPMQVPGLPKIKALAGGRTHAMALAKNGTLWAWGYNGTGQLGDGTRISRLTPAPLPQLGKVVAISAGMDHSQAVSKDGTAWGWGYNRYASVGDGTTSPLFQLTPTRVLLPSLPRSKPALGDSHPEPQEDDEAP